MSEAIPTKNKQRRQRKPKAKKINAGESKDFRFLEIAKLVRAHIPITVNGIAVSKIIDNYEAESQNEPIETALGEESRRLPTKRTKKIKLNIVSSHIERVIAKNPQQPLYLSFVIEPSDPDFPFDLDLLKFNLTVPSGYPRNSKAVPSLMVLNSDIPRGFAVNIERGFRQIALLAKNNELSPVGDEEITLVDGKGLLSQVQTLNKYLEVFLKQEKAQTMKFVTFKKSNALATPEPTPPPPSTHQNKTSSIPKALPPNVSAENLEVRAEIIKEMTTKLAKYVKLFNKSALEARYKVNIPLLNSQNIPYLWYINGSVDVFVTVPIEYPVGAPRVTLPSNFSTNILVAKKLSLEDCDKSMVQLAQEAKTAEKNVRKNVEAKISGTGMHLVELLNWISNNLGVLVLDNREFEAWRKNMMALGKQQEKDSHASTAQ